MKLAPALATTLDLADVGTYVLDEGWVMEQKLDGHRILLTSTDGVLKALSRDGTPYGHRLPSRVTDFRFPGGDWALDGELVEGTFWAFDLLVGGGVSYLGNALVERRAGLEAFLEYLNTPFGLVPQAVSSQEKEQLLLLAAQRSYEGVVLKRTNSTYPTGRRTPNWLKVKFVVTADVVVMDVRDDGKESAKLGIYRDGALCEIGRCSLLGRAEVNPGDVVEVRYIYVGATGRLVQPVLVRARPDKQARDCTGEDFKHVTKDVLTTLP